MALTVPQQQAAILAEGRTLISLHIPYLYGGKTLQGLDCSGFINLCYAAAGIVLPAGTSGLLASEIKQIIPTGSNMPKAEVLPLLQECDLVLPFDTHVELYVGDIMIMEEPHTGGFAQLVPWWADTIYAVLRPLATIVVVPPPTWPGVYLELQTPNQISTEVGEWQAQLKKLGYAISVDSDFGKQTDTITRQFQHNHELVVDGIVGKISWGAAFE